MLNSDKIAVINFIQAGAEHVPVAERIQLYHGMADFLDARDHARERKSFLDRACILEEAQAKCTQLNLKFKP